MRHPEGTHPGLTDTDDTLWNLKRYEKCLENWDVLNCCISLTHSSLVHDIHLGDEDRNKMTLRYWGLELLREVDNCD